MAPIIIQKATAKDASIIALLGRVTFAESFGHLFSDRQDLVDYCDTTFGVSKLTASLSKSNNIFWIAYVNDLPVGYAKLKLESSTPFVESDCICQLQKIYILKDFLSQKIGLELQNKLLATAQEKGFEKIWLSVWNGNKRAIRFYTKNHFTNVGTHTFQIGKELFQFTAMCKDLS